MAITMLILQKTSRFERVSDTNILLIKYNYYLLMIELNIINSNLTTCMVIIVWLNTYNSIEEHTKWIIEW